MAKLTLRDPTSGFGTAALVTANNTDIEAAIENTLSRDGTSPNQMLANLDMNSKLINNLAAPLNVNDAARLADVQAAISGLPIATLINITDTGNFYSSSNVEGALQQIYEDSADGLFVRYPQTATELSNAVTPIRDGYPPGDVRRYCTAVETNHQTAFTNAHLVSEVIYAPAGTWNVDHFLIDIDGRHLKTDGFLTVIKQRTGNINRRTIEVCANNVTIDSLKLEGNIATDTGEQQHAMLVSGDHPTGASRDIANIHIGNIYAKDVRGDALYLGAPAGFTTSNITVGIVLGENIYRNVCSIVSAYQVFIVGVYSTGGCGYETLDIEPNIGAPAATDIVVGWVRGGNLQCAPPTLATTCRRVYIGTADLDVAYQPNSAPGYSEGGSSYAVQIRTAVNLRNTVGFRIGFLRVRGHGYYAVDYIFNPGEQVGEDIIFDYVDIDGVGASEAVQNSVFNVANVKSMTINGGVVVLDDPTTDVVVLGSSATRDNQFEINNLKLDGTLVRFCSKSKFSGIIANHANNVVLIREADDFVLERSDITAGRFISNVTGATIISTKATCTTDYMAGTNSNLSLINCSGGLSTILQGSATYDPPNLVDGDGVTTTVTATGAALGDIVTGVSFSLDLQDVTLTAYVVSANTVEVRFQNESGGARDLASGTIRVYVKKV